MAGLLSDGPIPGVLAVGPEVGPRAWSDVPAGSCLPFQGLGGLGQLVSFCGSQAPGPK